MIDIKFLRENPDAVRENIRKKFQDTKLPLVDEAIRLDAEKRAAQQECEQLKAARNKLSKANGPLYGQLKKADEAQKSELQKQIDEMKASQADERVTHKLEMAGCKNTKAAKALLDDYDGDISKLKEACPYLFEDEKQKGKTGGKHIGSADKSIEDKIDSVFDN